MKDYGSYRCQLEEIPAKAGAEGGDGGGGGDGGKGVWATLETGEAACCKMIIPARHFLIAL
jgi:hypothetical protein